MFSKMKKQNVKIVLLGLLVLSVVAVTKHPYAHATIDDKAKSFIESTLFGGSERDGITCVKEDSQGNILITGWTSFDDFPVTEGAYQSTFGGGGSLTYDYMYALGYYAGDGFIANLSPSLNSILWASYIGGSSPDAILDMCTDSNGDIYLVGSTKSDDFPVTEDAYQSTKGLSPPDRSMADLMDKFIISLIECSGLDPQPLSAQGHIRMRQNIQAILNDGIKKGSP